MMGFFMLLALALALTTSIVAQSTCSSQSIIDTCVATLQASVNACSATDTSCLCTAYHNLAACYDSCPESKEAVQVQQSESHYCGNSSSSTLSATGSPTGSSEIVSSTTVTFFSSSLASSSVSTTVPSSTISTSSGTASSTRDSTASLSNISNSGTTAIASVTETRTGTATTSSSTPNAPTNNAGLTAAAQAGIGVGVTALVLAFILGLVYILRRTRTHNPAIRLQSPAPTGERYEKEGASGLGHTISTTDELDGRFYRSEPRGRNRSNELEGQYGIEGHWTSDPHQRHAELPAS